MVLRQAFWGVCFEHHKATLSQVKHSQVNFDACFEVSQIFVRYNIILYIHLYMLFYEPGCNDAKLDLQNYANSNLTFSLFTYRLIRVGLPKTGVS